jgi:hypothetical protein
MDWKEKKFIHKGNKQNKWNDNIKVNLWTKLNIPIEGKKKKKRNESEWIELKKEKILAF